MSAMTRAADRVRDRGDARRPSPDEPGPHHGDVLPGGDEPDERRTREIEIDVLLGHELAIASPAALHIWQAVGVTSPGPAEIRYQEPFPHGRSADVYAETLGTGLYVEDKAAGGRFNPGQLEDYRALSSEAPTVLVAPAVFLDNHPETKSAFTARVSLQQLADVLSEHQPSKDAVPEELFHSYRHRIAELKRLVEAPPVSLPDPSVDAVGVAYRHLAKDLSHGRIQVSPGSMRRTRTREIDFVAWATDEPLLRPYHKFALGVVDLRIPGYSPTQLELLLGALGSEHPPLPNGWRACRQGGGGRHAVLRYELETKLDGKDFAAFEPVAREAVAALVRLRDWWDTGGANLLRGSRDDALAFLIREAAIRADRRGYDEQAARLRDLAGQLGSAHPGNQDPPEA